MTELPKNKRVRIEDGDHVGEVGLFEKTYPDGMSSILLGNRKVAFCRSFTQLTILEEAQLIAKARGTSSDESVDEETSAPKQDPVADADLPPTPVERKKRGPKPGTKYKTRTTRTPEERPAEDTQPGPMQITPSPINDQQRVALSDDDGPILSHISMPKNPSASPPLSPTPLLIIVEPDGTTVLSTPVTKDNVTNIIRSLIDLVEAGK